MRNLMNLSLVGQRFLLLFMVPVLLVALSSCGSGSVEVADNSEENISVDNESDGVGQDGSDVETETTDQQSTGPEVTETEATDTETEATDTEVTEPETTEPDGSEQGSSDSATTIVQPNILLVITDDQGIDASAQYSLSSDLPDTPVINSLARNGITYENVWATPSCSTTRAALLTGKHGVNTGVLSVRTGESVCRRRYYSGIFRSECSIE